MTLGQKYDQANKAAGDAVKALNVAAKALAAGEFKEGTPEFTAWEEASQLVAETRKTAAEAFKAVFAAGRAAAA